MRLQALAIMYWFNHINALDRGQLSLQAAMKILIAQHVYYHVSPSGFSPF
jgi:hypothetical protein